MDGGGELNTSCPAPFFGITVKELQALSLKKILLCRSHRSKPDSSGASLPTPNSPVTPFMWNESTHSHKGLLFTFGAIKMLPGEHP